MANVLMLLSKGGCGGRGDDNKDNVKESSPGRVFECKTCSRRFTSFQALGGHRASHKKLRMAGGDSDGEGRAGLGKPRVHGCPICGLEFAVGQALGGHMRRHRGGAGGCCDDGNEKKAGERRMLCLDLNLAPPDSDVEECRDIALGMHRVRQIPIVDFFY
ncbi:uncharacterized protein [Typha angustifolia]|uniref:uncharacterized protein n=1 Tax=Typha angustifolia TaxID=59011 RepID=UPI003C2BC65C